MTTGKNTIKEATVALSLANDIGIPATVIYSSNPGTLGGSALTDPRIAIPARSDGE